MGKEFQEVQGVVDAQIVMHPKEDFAVEYAAARTVLEVEAAGRPIKVSDVIEKLSLIRRGNRTELAKPGSVLVASTEGKKKRFEIDGRLVDAQSAKALEVVVDISQGGATDDDIFGTKSRKKPGESWEMNRALAAQDLAKRTNVEARNLAGKVTLESVTHDPTGDILNLTWQVTGDARPLQLPAAITSLHGPFKATFSGKYPLDQSLGCHEGSLEMTFLVEGNGQARNGAQLSATGEMKRSITYKMMEIK
jgi:hypothetical protein